MNEETKMFILVLGVLAVYGAAMYYAGWQAAIKWIAEADDEDDDSDDDDGDLEAVRV